MRQHLSYMLLPPWPSLQVRNTLITALSINDRMPATSGGMDAADKSDEFEGIALAGGADSEEALRETARSKGFPEKWLTLKVWLQPGTQLCPMHMGSPL